MFFFFFHLPPPSSSSSSNLSKKIYLPYSCSCCRHHSRSPTAHHPEHHAHCSGLSTFKLGSSCAAPGALCSLHHVRDAAAAGVRSTWCEPQQVRCSTSCAAAPGALLHLSGFSVGSSGARSTSVLRRWCAQHPCTGRVERAAPVRFAAPPAHTAVRRWCAGGERSTTLPTAPQGARSTMAVRPLSASYWSALHLVQVGCLGQPCKLAPTISHQRTSRLQKLGQHSVVVVDSAPGSTQTVRDVTPRSRGSCCRAAPSGVAHRAAQLAAFCVACAARSERHGK
ncbi:hypothetical protein I3760_06G009300 [Carya illinoinensis]|nr:hypothetical protein I3760_06G009300 [Carya illinoinensis]